MLASPQRTRKLGEMRGPDLDFLASKFDEAIKDSSSIDDIKNIMSLMVAYTQKVFLNKVYGVANIPGTFLNVVVSMALAVIILL